MKSIKLILFISLSYLGVFAQVTKPNLKLLHVGDEMPDVTFTISNYKTKTAKISDFKDKVLILDFWGVYCGTCIMQMPKLEKLQNDFKDKIQIIRVCRDSREDVNKLMKRSEILRNCTLPLVTGESGLAKMFNLPLFPFYAWIVNGSIKYLTDEEITNVDGLNKYFADVQMNIPEKVRTRFNYDDPMLTIDNPSLKRKFLSYTYLAPADKQDSIHFKTVSLKRDSNVVAYRFTCAPCDLPLLYVKAYKNARDYAYKNVILDLPEADTIIDRSQSFNSGKHKYAFDIALSNPKSKDDIFKLMRQQLDLNFGYRSSIQKRKVKCYLIKRIGEINIDTKFKVSDNVKGYEKDLKFMHFRYLSWNTIIDTYTKFTKSPELILDETGIEADRIVDFDLQYDLFDLKSANESLKRYGLAIEEGERDLDMIVIEKAKANLKINN